MNAHLSRTLAATALAAAALGSALGGVAIAHADVINAYEDNGVVHVNLSELPTIDSMPMCEQEDGSDIDPALLPCVWTNDGNAWLTFADRSFLIVDDTVTPARPCLDICLGA